MLNTNIFLDLCSIFDYSFGYLLSLEYCRLSFSTFNWLRNFSILDTQDWAKHSKFIQFIIFILATIINFLRLLSLSVNFHRAVCFKIAITHFVSWQTLFVILAVHFVLSRTKTSSTIYLTFFLLNRTMSILFFYRFLYIF